MTDYSDSINKFKLVKSGSKVAILGLGNFFELGEKLVNEFKKNLNIDATLINPRFISGLDIDMLDNLKHNHDIVVTLEDGMLNGGFGQKVASYYGNSDIKVLNYGADKDFPDRVPLDVLYKNYRLTPAQIVEDVSKLITLKV